jgi:hypothetical protein
MEQEKNQTIEKKAKYFPENKKLFLILILFFFFILTVLFFYFFYLSSIIEKREVYANVIVSDHLGINLNDSALIFGMILPGSSSTKELTIKNNYGRDVRLEFFISGDIEKYLRSTENDFLLKKDEVKNVSFIVTIPDDSPYRVYEGKVMMIVKKI